MVQFADASLVPELTPHNDPAWTEGMKLSGCSNDLRAHDSVLNSIRRVSDVNNQMHGLDEPGVPAYLNARNSINCEDRIQCTDNDGSSSVCNESPRKKKGKTLNTSSDGSSSICNESPRKKKERALMQQTNVSIGKYSAPSETVIFLDWDDTLFPTRALFGMWNLPELGPLPKIPASRKAKLEKWAASLGIFLKACTECSDCVCIVTSSAPGWVETCVERFAPGLQAYLEKIPVMYSIEELPEYKKLASQSNDLRPVKQRESHLNLSAIEINEELTAQKRASMEKAVKQFYGARPWQNILSFGDMSHEHDALQDITFLNSQEARCRTKACILPTRPSVTETDLRLQILARVMPAFVALDNDIDLDLKRAPDALQAILAVFDKEPVASLAKLTHAWGSGAYPTEEVAPAALETLSSLVCAVG